MNKKRHLDPENKFIELLQQEKFKEALLLLKSLPESEQVKHLKNAYSKKESDPNMIDMTQLKTVSVLNRKLKPEHSYADFYQAWLPPTANDPNEKTILKRYFGLTGPGCVIHAINLKDSSEIISIGLMSADQSELEKMIQTRADTELQRHNNIAKVSDKIGDTKLLEIIDVILK